MIPLITLTTFLGALLTFLLEPLIAKMVLPLFGGTPSVWNTCVLFFQAMLLAGYGYSHLSASATRWRKLAIVHLSVLAIPLAVLPFAIAADWAPRLGTPPVLWQLSGCLSSLSRRLAFHISNRFLDLETVVGSLARDAGIEAVSWADLALSDAQRRTGKLPSHWVVLSADPALTELLKASGGWKPVEPRSGSPVWTDRFSNLLGVFRWSR